MQEPNLDPISVATVVAAMMVGQQLAPYAAAYSVIFVGAFAGAVIALWRREPASRVGGLGYAAVLMLLSIGCTVGVSSFVADLIGKPSAWLFFPVAVALSAIGEDWVSIGKWAVGVLRDVIQRKAGAANGND
jgi:hypothetical protein